MALADNAVITLADLKVRLGIAETKTLNDAEYEKHIDAISTFLANYLDRDIIAPTSAEDEIFNGTGTQSYYNRHHRFNNVDVSVPVVSYRSGDGTEWTVMTTSSYPREFENNTGLTYLVDSVFSEGERNYKINYRQGWLITEVPEAIKVAAAELVRRTVNRIEKTGLAEENVGGASTTYDLGMLMNDAIRSLLQPYRVISFG